MENNSHAYLAEQQIYRCVLVDDDPKALEILNGYLQRMPNFEVVRFFSEPVEALSYIKSANDLDFVFLDVEMPELTGIDLAAALRTHVSFIIFTTGHPSYAEKAYDLGVDQFLVKPFTMARLKEKLQYLLSRKNVETPEASPILDLRFVNGPDAFVMEPLDLSKVLYIESDRNNSVVYSKDDVLRIPYSLKFLEQSLDPKLFIRVARSYIVSAKGIRRIEGYDIHLDKGILITVGVPYRSAFKDFMRHYRLNRSK